MIEASQQYYAGFWKRFAAYIIDYIITFLAGVILGLILRVAERFLGISPNSAAITSSMISLLIGWLYFALMESSEKQGTLGKIVLGIKVTDHLGRKISFARASGRFWAKLLSVISLGVGYIMAAFTKKKQALHDMVADCLVVNR